MNRADLTASFLDEVARRGVSGGDLLSVMPETGLLAAKYQKRFLSRPLFIGPAERDQLNADLQQVRTALVSLPDRLYGGDAAFLPAPSGPTRSWRCCARAPASLWAAA